MLAGLAETAALSNYIKPHVHDGDELSIVDGRHPVVERRCNGAFVPNDTTLDGASSQLVILTGPNMGGKSTYLRQTALICLMAQAGSFVPATRAKIGIVDRIYARVGASDNITRGQSTFMVEMQETANILHGATSRSLVVLDEIGRGTATFDGLSIAWAVAEYLATNQRGRPKTLFATHYHELTDLADALPGVVNAHVAAREWQDDIVFLHKIVPGRSDRSYGIQVARLAGMPAAGHHARARDSRSARARRADARRPAVDQRHAVGAAAAARAVSDGVGGSRRREARAAAARRRHGQPDAAAGAVAAGRPEEGAGVRALSRVTARRCARLLASLLSRLLSAAARTRHHHRRHSASRRTTSTRDTAPTRTPRARTS